MVTDVTQRMKNSSIDQNNCKFVRNYFELLFKTHCHVSANVKERTRQDVKAKMTHIG